MESTKHILLPSIVAVFVNIIINLIFLEDYGIIISAISSLVASSISNLLLYIRLNKIMPIKILNQSTIILLIICIVISAIIFSIQSSSIIQTMVIKTFILCVILLIILLVRKCSGKYFRR
ncbi:polysaccharide biosynthesis C-terminal domain-containing protein [Staphylococcus equorum]|uniref:polysaccharide biosynthesis C-terminal domain-containing protein n=1 Tax=Staphylococcus equorum TaxID=246432 RepID=UPI003BB15063